MDAPLFIWLSTLLQLCRVVWAHRQASLLFRVPLAPEPATDAAAPSVTVIVPARNEEANIGACLEGLSAQTYPSIEIVVVDDRSSDATPDIVRQRTALDPRIRLLEGQPLPDGWIGKCWALHQGAHATESDWLLFVDADTRLLPGAVTSAVAEAQRRDAPVFSVLTHQQLPTHWERIFMPAIFGSLAEAMPIEFVNDPRLPQFAIANGQFLMVRRDAYEAMGGHEAIKDEIGEDARFAQRAKQLGWRYWLGDGRRLATTRMYATPGALWEGWTKNLHVGARLLPWIIPPGIVAFIIGLLAPFVLLFRGLRHGSRTALAAGALQLGAALYERRGIDRIYEVPPVYALTYPLGQVGFLALLIASFYKVLTGQGVTWKGRRYYASA